MNKILTVWLVACVLMVGACAKVETAWENVTSATVTTKTVYVFENAYIALEQTATNYISLPSCSKPAAPKVCSDDSVVAKIVPAVRSLRAANDNLVQIQKNHPDQLGTSGVYDVAKASYNTLLTILSTYGVSVASK